MVYEFIDRDNSLQSGFNGESNTRLSLCFGDPQELQWDFHGFLSWL